MCGRGVRRLAPLLLLASLAQGSNAVEGLALVPHHPGGATWGARPATLGPSPFEGLTIRDAIAMMGTRNQGPEALAKATAAGPPAPPSIPASFDLRDTHGHCGAMTRVLNQGACGSCYAMASTQAVSTALCMGAESGGGADDALLSTQDMLGCSGTGNSTVKLSCWGGTITEALGYLCEFGAVEESCVPYTAGFTWRDSQSVDGCRRSCAIPQAHVRRRAVPNATAKATPPPAEDAPGGGSAAKAPSKLCAGGTMLLNTAAQVQSAVMTFSPAVAYLDVYRSFLHYSDGVYKCPQPSHCTRVLAPSKKECPLQTCASNPDCERIPPGPTCKDCLLGGHAVQIVGWGADGATGAKFWLVKNSWGVNWGDGGYFKISAAPEENCNLMVDCTDPTRAKECIAGVSPNNPYAPAPGVRASEPQVPGWEELAAWALCVGSLVSACASAWLLATTLRHSELRQYPFNRLTLAALFLVPLSLAQASFLPMEALFLVDDPLACSVAGRVYVVSTLGFAATCAVTALTTLAHSFAPIERGEGCSHAWTCVPNGLVFLVLSVGLPVGLCVAQAFALDNSYWPSPLRCTMHSQRWTQLLFDVPMGGCLVACLLAALANLAYSTRNPEEHSREWTAQRMQWVLLAGVAIWVPEAILAALVALDVPTGQPVLVFVGALCTGLVGLCFTAAAIRALDLDMFVSWKELQNVKGTTGPGDSEVDAFLPGLERGQGRRAMDRGFTFFEGWGEAVTVESGWHGSQSGLSPQGSGSTESDSLPSMSGIDRAQSVAAQRSAQRRNSAERRIVYVSMDKTMDQ